MDKEELFKRIGFKIREIRESKDISIMGLSDKTDIEYNNIVRIEKGRTNATIATLYNIAKALDVKLSDIVDIE